MIYPIPDILSPDELAQLRRLLAAEPFADGRATVGAALHGMKRNLELPSHGAGLPGTAEAARIVAAALVRSEAFMELALPRRITPLLFNRYEPGMFYGAHVDESLMGEGPTRLRCDLSLTVFVSAPDEYEGGELLINCDGPTVAAKQPAGHMVLYPADTLHQVAPVTAGVRVAAVGWVMSEIRRPDQRAILWELKRSRDELALAGLTQDPNGAYHRISKVRTNLLRMWAEP